MGYHDVTVVKEVSEDSGVVYRDRKAVNAITIEIVPAIVPGEGFDKLLPKSDVYKHEHLFSNGDMTYVILYVIPKNKSRVPDFGFGGLQVGGITGMSFIDDEIMGSLRTQETPSMTSEEIAQYIADRLDDPSLIEIA